MLNGIFQINIDVPGDNEIMCGGDVNPDNGCKNSLCNKAVCVGNVYPVCAPSNALHKCTQGLVQVCVPSISVAYRCKTEVCCVENTQYKK